MLDIFILVSQLSHILSEWQIWTDALTERINQSRTPSFPKKLLFLPQPATPTMQSVITAMTWTNRHRRMLRSRVCHMRLLDWTAGFILRLSFFIHLPLLAPRSGNLQIPPPSVPHHHHHRRRRRRPVTYSRAHCTYICCQAWNHSLLHATDAPSITHKAVTVLWRRAEVLTYCKA